ncbi:MAG: translation initiation factor IF-2 [Limisphaerales bacterium]|nr:MAG: translation initiation factor IF-2 [Limisphaerales bacterium]KAG0509342.1 MAG: translation initiation factor IF-2 [Limisphaerales bacterium]TXT52087.1 MAG: translation initiation factor IF-2 [Limisphaerales bacterium]
MKLPTVFRPLFTALCGISLAALPDASTAQERAREDRPRENAPRDERPAEGQRPPRGDFRPDERRREEGRPAEGARREEFRRDDAPRGEGRPGEGQRGPGNQQFNPQELFRDLNDDQRNALRGFFEAQQNVMRETGERSMRLRREIAESALADKPNEQAIREKIMQAAQLEAEATIVRARAFAQVRDKLPKETVERLRGMIANAGPRPGMQGPMQGQGGQRGGEFRRPDGQREGEQFRRPAGEGDRRPAEGDFRRPAGPRDGDQIRKPGEGDRGPRPDGDRGPRPDGDRGRNPEGGDRKPELPRRPPADQ